MQLHTLEEALTALFLTAYSFLRTLSKANASQDSQFICFILLVCWNVNCSACLRTDPHTYQNSCVSFTLRGPVGFKRPLCLFWKNGNVKRRTLYLWEDLMRTQCPSLLPPLLLNGRAWAKLKTLQKQSSMCWTEERLNIPIGHHYISHPRVWASRTLSDIRLHRYNCFSQDTAATNSTM